jgi:monoamine oxidase
MLRAVRDPYDVIVIGGGFCGVTAARECAKSGLRTLVLEARDRLGGRTHTTVWNGSVTELGGTWVHWTQPYVWAEIERYGLALAESDAGAGHVTLRRSGGDLARVDFASQVEKILGAVAQYMGPSRRMFPRPHRPFDTGIPEKHDRVTAADPLERIADRLVRDFLDAFIATSVGNRAREAAWVEMVRWYALAGHNYFDHVTALARYRFRDGTKALIGAMLADGKPELRLGEAVARVHQDGAGVIVGTASGEELVGRAAISTLPLNVLRDVSWEPALDPRKLEASAQRHAGASTKVHVLIEGEQRVSCLAPSESALNSLTSEHAANGRTHLIGFGPSPELLDVGDAAQVERAVRGLLPDARVLDSTAWDWNADAFSRGTWCTLRPGQYSRHLAALQQPAGRVFFASADWANGWRGNIDGAIEQGLAAARQVRALLA